ncbi:MAG: PilZ domain-containing protein [Elusimicrobia bacterium]|nr:PilZ domain-containing protein [Elusimicrobiota bacterium]
MNTSVHVLQEKRQAPRISLNSNAAIYAGNLSKPISSNIKVCDISETGFSLEGTIHLVPGSTYRFQIALPNGGQISGQARIIWKHPNPYIQSYGAQLEEIQWLEKRKLKKHLDRLLGNRSKSFTFWPLFFCGMVLYVGFKWLELVLSFGWPALFAGIALLMLSHWLILFTFRRHA